MDPILPRLRHSPTAGEKILPPSAFQLRGILEKTTFHKGVTGQNEHTINRPGRGFRAVYAGGGTLLSRAVEQCDAELRAEVSDIPASPGARRRAGGTEKRPCVQLRLRSHPFISYKAVPGHDRCPFRPSSVSPLREPAFSKGNAGSARRNTYWRLHHWRFLH